jgi:Zn-dependent protease
VLGSWKIGRLFGIDVRLHWTFLVVYAVVLGSAGALSGTLLFLGAFVSVLLHELGHSLVARRMGVTVLDITFWPLGGMARMSAIPEEPRREALIAAAGPAVNFVLAALAAPLLVASLFFGLPPVLAGASGGFLAINLVLGTFNLVPAFPMDGGRLLRAFLAAWLDYVRATEIAVAVGRVVAALMLALTVGLALFRSQTLCALPLVALFVWFAGGRELFAVRLRHGRLGAFPLAGGFAAAPPPPAPPPADAGPRRPAVWDAAPPAVGRSGFSEETLRRLERFPGPLRRPPQED